MCHLGVRSEPLPPPMVAPHRIIARRCDHPCEPARRVPRAAAHLDGGPCALIRSTRGHARERGRIDLSAGNHAADVQRHADQRVQGQTSYRLDSPQRPHLHHPAGQSPALSDAVRTHRRIIHCRSGRSTTQRTRSDDAQAAPRTGTRSYLPDQCRTRTQRRLRRRTKPTTALLDSGTLIRRCARRSRQARVGARARGGSPVSTGIARAGHPCRGTNCCSR